MAKVLSGSILYYTHIHHIEWDRIQLAKSLSFVRKSHFMTGGMRHSAPHNGKNVQYQMLFTLENGLPADESLTFFLANSMISWVLAHYRVQKKFFNLYDAWVNTIYSIGESFISNIQKDFCKVFVKINCSSKNSIIHLQV